MREIKGPRVWDDVLGKMLYSKFEQYDDSIGFRFSEHLETESPVYMWPTGLKDKNGKEIYEGDVIGRKSTLTGEMYYYKVEWDAETARFMAVGETIHELVSSSLERGNVWLGNIYEHPELK